MALTTIAFIPPLVAEEDTNLRLNQSIEQDASQRERKLLEEEQQGLETALPTLIIDGQKYAVDGDVNAMGRALYVSVQQKQWSAVATLLPAYQKLYGTDPMLLHYAKGGLARVRGHLAEAERQYHSLLALKADFLLGQLALARVLFEDHQNSEATELFERIRDSLNAELAQTDGVRRTIETFLQALDKRLSWQGKIALGPTYDNNLNRSSESYICLIPSTDGGCFFDRSVPAAVADDGVSYETALEKAFAISGHRGIFVRGLAYGNAYRDQPAFNEDHLSLSAGYRYRSAGNLYSLAPLYEVHRRGSDTLYRAWGSRAEWMYFISRHSVLRLEGSYTDQHYRSEYSHVDGATSALYATAWRMLDAQWSLFGGVDLVDKRSRQSVYGYQQEGLRLGFVRRFSSGIKTTLSSSFRQRKYAEFSTLLEAQRHDKEQNYSLLIEMPRFAWLGFNPSIRIEHSRVESNVDWLYSYRRNVLSMKFEYTF